MNQRRKTSTFAGIPRALGRADETAFTLIELSIVLVIIGLIVGGVLAGQSLIQQAKINKIANEAQQITAAVNTFRTKYDCLPGDCANATTFWGLFVSGANCAGDGLILSGTLTCNGNGDFQIDNNYTSTYKGGNPSAVRLEQFIFWQHLNNAGLSPFGGLPYAGDDNPPLGININGGVPGQNIPQSATGLGGWSVTYWNIDAYSRTGGACGAMAVMGECSSPWSDNVLELGGLSSDATRLGTGGYGKVVSPNMARQLDFKMDDGVASTGRLRGGNNAAPCSNAGGTDWGTTDTPSCYLVFTGVF